MDYSEEQKFFQYLLKVYVWLIKRAYGLDLTLTGELKLMAHYIVKDDNPDVGFKLTLGEVTDSEGSVITDPAELATLVTEIVSTAPGVVGFTPGADDKSGSVHFGTPGDAALQYSVKDAAGNVLGSGADNFTVTTGDPKAIAGVTGTFDGLTASDAGAPAAAGTTAPAGVDTGATAGTSTAPADTSSPANPAPADTATPSTDQAPPTPGFGE